MKKKLMTIVLCLCMVLTLLPAAALAVEFNDTEGTWAADSIQRWVDAGIIQGDGTGSFNPEAGLDRGSAAKIVSALMKYSEEADTSKYTDVDKDAWYQPWIAKAVKGGVMNGIGGDLMDPTGEVSREMMFVMVARAVGIKGDETTDKEFPDLEDTSDWAAPYINALVNMNVLSGGDDGTLAPVEDIDRASTMSLLDKLIGGYANKDGDTVTIEENKLTLIVADNVKVEGDATAAPIVIAGDTKTVDMKDVKGEAVVNVNTSDVTIKNAPVGTQITAAENVENVTANDIDVTGDPDNEVVIPEPEPESEPEPEPEPEPPTDNVTATTIDDIIEKGREAVNAKMHGEDNIDYAVIPEFEKTGVRDVQVIIYDTEVKVTDVYHDIVKTLVDALNAHHTEVATITGVSGLDGQEISSGAYAQYKTLTLDGTTEDADVANFVRALVGENVQGATSLNELVTEGSNSFTVEVDDVENGSVDTKVQYKVTFKMASLDDVIAEKINGIDDLMNYAKLDWDADNHTLNVDISSSTTDINTVYTAIATPLCDAFNLVRAQLKEVKDAVNTGNGKTLEIGGAIKNTDFLEFIKGLQLVNSLADTEKKELTAVLSEGRGSLIAALKGFQFEIDVTPRENLPTGASDQQKYTIKFIAPALDDVIAKEIPNISTEMSSYATAEWKNDEEQHTLEVTITNGDTKVGKVYDDIAGMLCTAFNESRNTLSSVVDALNSESDQSKLDLNTALTNDALKTFVMALKIKNDSDQQVKTVMEVLREDTGLIIKGLSGYHFEINVTAKGADEEAVP